MEIDGIPWADARVEVAERSPSGDEDVLLGGQVGAAGLDEVDRRETVLEGDVGRAKGLAQRVRVARPAFHRRIAGADQAFDTADDTDAGDDAGANGVRRAIAGQRTELEERGILVEEQLDALAGEQLAALVVPLGVLPAAAGDRRGMQCVDVGESGQHRIAVGGELGGTSVEVGAQHAHPHPTDLGGLRFIGRFPDANVITGATESGVTVTAAGPRGCRHGGPATIRRGPWPAGRSGHSRRRLRRASHR